MTLPTYGQPIVRADIEAGATTLAELDDVAIAAPAAGDILIYDGVDSWRNRAVTGDITINSVGLVAISAGVIVDADISATAEIQVSKLANGAARQLIQTDVAGTGVEWTNDIDIPGTLDVAGVATFDDVISAIGGQVLFPAVQVPSADGNALDDYEEGSWTPVLTFAAPGDQSIAYTTQIGRYVKVGRMVTVWFNILTSTFTHTTASGQLEVTGLPFTTENIGGLEPVGVVTWGGVTKASYTHLVWRTSGNVTITSFDMSGSAQTVSRIDEGDVPTGGPVDLVGAMTYRAAA